MKQKLILNKPGTHAHEKLSKAANRLGGPGGDLCKKIHDAWEGLAVVAHHDLRPLQARVLEQITEKLTAEEPPPGVQALDPRVMYNLQQMSPEQREAVASDIRLLHEDVSSYYA